MSLLNDIENFCEVNTTLYGFANIQEYTHLFIEENLKKYKYAISIGINIPDDILDNLSQKDAEIKYLETYNKVNSKLDEITKFLEGLIIDSGFNAKSVKASEILPNNKLEGKLSHKMIARLSGLGWIGKSCLLITPHYGPRVRWATVLTDFELPSNNTILKSRCNTCRLCVVNCPSNAFTGVEFDEKDSRSTRYDAFKCYDHFAQLEEQGRPRLCGLCVKVCPWGLVNKNSRTKEDIIGQE